MCSTASFKARLPRPLRFPFAILIFLGATESATIGRTFLQPYLRQPYLRVLIRMEVDGTMLDTYQPNTSGRASQDVFRTKLDIFSVSPPPHKLFCRLQGALCNCKGISSIVSAGYKTVDKGNGSVHAFPRCQHGKLREPASWVLRETQ